MKPPARMKTPPPSARKVRPSQTRRPAKATPASLPPTPPEALYRALFECSPVAIFIEDAAGNILDLNPTACQVFGYARAELLGQNIRLLVPPEHHARVAHNLNEPLAGRVLIHEVWSVRKDGSVSPMELHEQRLVLPDGQIGILVLAHDITARKRAEETLRLRDTALQAAANAIVVTDHQGNIVWANPAFSRSTGYTLKEVLGQNPRLVQSGVHDAAFYQQLWDTILAGRVWQGELVNRRRDGSHFTESATITPIRDAAGTITHFIAVKQDVTERKRMQEELRRSEQFVRATLDALTTHIAILDEKGIILDVNQAWREFARQRQDAAPNACEGAAYLDVCRQAIGERSPLKQEIAAGLQAVLQGQTPTFACEFVCDWSGQLRWFVSRVTRFVGSGPARLVVAHEDVTQRKQAEQALTRSGHQYRVLTETMKDVVWILNAENLRFRYVSPSVELLRGYTAAEVMAEPAACAFVPATAAEVIGLMRQRAETFRLGRAPADQFYVSEVEQPRKDGSTVWTEVVTSYHVNPETSHIEVWGASRDITEREQARRALQQAKEQFQSLFLASPLPIVVLDRAGAVRLWSPAAEDMFGWTAAEVLDQPSPSVPEEQLPEFGKHLERVLAGETIRGSEPRQRQRKDGTLVDVLVSAAPLNELDGSVSGVIVVYTDLTEKAQLEAQLLRAQRLESIGHLAGGIAHDLNNILMPVLMAAPMLRPELTTPESLSLLTLVENSAHRGAAIVKQILAFARGAQVEKVPVQTRHLLRETADAIHASFPQNIRLKINFPRELWLVEGNSTQLHQVVMNLCLNARDAMPDGGTLTLAAENLEVPEALARRIANGRPGPHVVWTIQDTGQGIAPGDLGRIFDPFFTTKEVGKGTGLGLATVYGIVRFHGGFLDVQSALGQGTEFKIYLPATPDSLPQPESPTPLVARGRGEHILVVDDEENIRQLLGTLLVQYGYHVTLAADGYEAVGLAQRPKPRVALVLTDLMMPRMNGAQLIRALHQTAPRLKTIVMTGLPDDALLAELAHLGVRHLLQKPCNLPTLLKAVREELDAT